jgi:aerobic-type carbon monoxide dehydrogenase small subunit (CoxS/CutS family)
MSAPSVPTKPLTLTVNGEIVGPLDVPEDMMLIDVLHEYLGLTGTRFGCGEGLCRSCAVILDGDDGSQELSGCLTAAHQLAGRSIRTVEGHAKRDARGAIVALSPVQQAFVEGFSFQCGYCTPGYVNAATVLMERLANAPARAADLEAAITEALDPHLCRCTGYVRYFRAVKALILATPGLVVS